MKEFKEETVDAVHSCVVHIEKNKKMQMEDYLSLLGSIVDLRARVSEVEKILEARYFER